MRIALLDHPALGDWPDDGNRFRHVGALLAAAGHEVLLLVPEEHADHVPAGVRPLVLEQSPWLLLTGLNRAAETLPLALAYRAGRALAPHEPELVIAPLRGGLAHGVLQARSCGEAFAGTRVALWADTTSRERILNGDDLACGLADLVADALERQCLGLADAVLLPEPEARTGLASLGAVLPPGFAARLPPLRRRAQPTGGLGALLPLATPSGPEPIDEIVFLGALRRDAGAAAFVRAIEEAMAGPGLGRRGVTFIGPARAEAAGIGKIWLGMRAAGWTCPFRLVETRDRAAAADYVSAEGRLAILCSDAAEDRAMLDPGLSRHVHVPPAEWRDLPDRLARLLARGAEPLPRSGAPTDWPGLAASLGRLPRPERVAGRTGVSVCILHKDRPLLLAEAIASIPAGLDGRPLEILIVDNASATGAAHAALADLASRLPHLRVLALAEPVPAAIAYNRAVREAAHAIVVFLDDDNLFAADGLRRLVAGLDDPANAIVVSTLDVFEDAPGLAGASVARTIFVGEGHSAGLFFNAFGDTAMAARRDAFLGIGGYREERETYPCLDWVVLGKAQAAGLRIAVLQQPAVRYRRDGERARASAQKLDQEGARLLVHETVAPLLDLPLVARLAQKLHLGG